MIKQRGLKTEPPQSLEGLSFAEARKRLANSRHSDKTETKTKTVSEILIENAFSVFNLIIGSIILFFLFFYLKTLDRRLILDAVGLSTVAMSNTAIAVFQELKAKRALDKVKLLLKKEASVLREGRLFVIPQNELVPGDIIYLQRGDQAVVDGQAVNSNHLEIDESLLTGESIPIHKEVGDQILSGSFCLAGAGYYVAEKIGHSCYASQVTKMAKKYKFALTPLQKRINVIVKALFAIAVALVVLKVFITRSNLMQIDSIREMGTILDSLVPQGLVLMSSVTFALGVYRISRTGAIVQKLNAVESFAGIQVACMDKTGTLTQDLLAVHRLIPLASVSEEIIERHLGTYAWLCCDKNSTVRALERFSYDQAAEIVDEIPFNSRNKMSCLTIRSGDVQSTFVLGAYDLLLEKISAGLQHEIINEFSENRLDIYRNLLFGTISGNRSLAEIRDNPGQYTLDPICIISITDKVREDSREALELFERKGIELKILSGDSAASVQAVCREIGWDVGPEGTISGDELDSVEKGDFARAVKNNRIFARLKPEHKLRIIKELRKQKIYTAMLGDGVNDLPAIKEADLGIAMEEGSAVTKEVADIVLLNNKFSILPEIFDEGSRIINTVGAIAKLFLTKNFIVVWLALLSSFFFLEFPLTPRRVSLVNIFAIGLPSLFIAATNKRSESYGHFLLDLFTFAGISTMVIVTSAYIAFFMAESIPDNLHAECEMVMVSVIIVLAIVNFLAITVHKSVKENCRYIAYAFLMLLSYWTLVSVRSNNLLVKLMEIFYEIFKMRWPSWRVVIIVVIPSSLLLLLLQAIRGRLVEQKSLLMKTL